MPTVPEPTAARPAIPREYGVASGPDGMLPWASVEAQLAAAKLLWVATASAGGRPRVRPVDGTWFEGVIYVGGSLKAADLAVRGSIATRPRTIVAWRDFGKDPTRFRFD